MGGTVVRFNSGFTLNPTFGYVDEVQVGPLDYPGIYTSQLVDTTDGSGRVSVALRYGPLATRGRLIYSVGDFHAPTYKDTLHFDISPGAPVATRMARRKTARSTSTIHCSFAPASSIDAAIRDRSRSRTRPDRGSASPTRGS
jgi:hypothetical protein